MIFKQSCLQSILVSFSVIRNFETLGKEMEGGVDVYNDSMEYYWNLSEQPAGLVSVFLKSSSCITLKVIPNQQR